MGKNVQHVQHVKSNVVENGSPKLPTPSVLAEGEIAINFAEGYETLSIKSSSGNIKTFSSDEYYTEQKLGSGFTGVNSGKSVTDVIVENEEIISSALTDLDNRKLDASAYTPTDLSNYYTKDETSGKTEISTALSGKQNTLTTGTGINITNDVISVNADQIIDSTTSASTNAVSTSAVYGFVTSYTPSITVDQVLDNTTSASTNPVSSKAVYDAIVDNELVWTNAYVALSGTVSAHTENTDIHLTQTEKTNIDSLATNIAAISGITSTNVTNWNNASTDSHTHSNKSALDSITSNVGTMAYEDKTSYSSATEVNTALGNKANASDLDNFFDGAKYEDSGTTKVINFYHGNTIKATIDASDFIVDGMVESVSAVTSGNTTVLDIKWNTAAGGQETIVDIGDIFEADNYYTKTNIDGLVGSGFTSSSITDVIIENEEIVSTALTDLDERKLDASAYTPTDLSNYYTKSETSGATELTTAFSAKANTATTLAGYGITDAYTKSETSGATQISNALGAKVDSATYNTHTGDTTIHFTTGTVQTQIDNSISGKVNTSDIISAITPSNSGSTAPIATKVVAENELVMSNALNDLDERKLDASAYTPTDLSNYYTKSETSGATEISNALGGKVNSATFTGHTADTSMHFTTTEKTNLDSLATNIAAISGITSTKVSNWDTAYTNNHTHSNKTALDSITGSVGTMAYQSTSSYSSATQVNGVETVLTAHTANTTIHVTSENKTTWNAVTAKTDNSAFTAHTASTVHMTTTEKTNLDSLATNIAAISGVSSTKVSNWDTAYTNNHTHNNKTYLDGITGSVGTMAYQNTSSYSSATQVNTALAGKSGTGHTHVSSAVTAMTGYAKAASGSSIATSDTLNQVIGKLEASVDDKIGRDEYEDDMFVVATALTDLQDNVADLNSQSETIAAALVDLYNKIGDIETLLSQI